MRILLVSLLIFAISILCVPAFGQGMHVPDAKCPLQAMQDAITASGATQLIPAPSSGPVVFIGSTANVNPLAKSIIVCSVNVQVVQGAAPADYGLVTGTGTNCGTATANLTPQWAGTASVKERWDFLWEDDSPLIAPAGTALCLNLSAAPTKAKVLVKYAIAHL